MTDVEKRSAIKRYADSAEPLLARIVSADERMMDFRPDIEDSWTIREHLAHFLHADVFCYTRVGLSIAEPGATLYVWDENAWVARVKPHFMDAKSLVDTIRSVRKAIAALAESVPAADWDVAVANHPKRGKMQMADILALYGDHAVFHMKYVNRNLEAAKTLS